MRISAILFLFLFPVCTTQSAYASSLAEQFAQQGYVEINNTIHDASAFEALYASFDALITFLQTNPAWVQKLYSTKERFIRSKERQYYGTDFFGFYDESEREGRFQISFYYTTHLHASICSQYHECNQVPEIRHFFDACLEIQKPYGQLFNEAATELGVESLFASDYGQPPILLKVVQYLPTYAPTRPHYDGTVLTLLLHSTHPHALLISPYKPSYTVDDFYAPARKYTNSLLLIPGTLLTAFSIYPTPHIVMHSGTTRYATIAFAMQPHHSPRIQDLSPLPPFNY